MSDLEFELSRSLKVKSNGAIPLAIYDFLLVSNSNYMSNSHRLGVTRQKFSYLLNSTPPPPTHTHTHALLPRADFFQNRVVSRRGHREAFRKKWS